MKNVWADVSTFRVRPTLNLCCYCVAGTRKNFAHNPHNPHLRNTNPPREPSPVGGADLGQLTCLDCGRAQVLQSRLPLKNLLFTNKFGSKVAVDELPVQ